MFKRLFKNKLVGTIVTLSLLVFIGIQFIPVERTNPPVEFKVKWDSKNTEDFARAACFDCHSNETRWPFYSYIAPISWLVAKDVKRGRMKLNFSEEDYGEIDEIIEEIEKGEMPLKSYVLLHPRADIGVTATKEFVQGLKLTFGESASKDKKEKEE